MVVSIYDMYGYNPLQPIFMYFDIQSTTITVASPVSASHYKAGGNRYADICREFMDGSISLVSYPVVAIDTNTSV